MFNLQSPSVKPTYIHNWPLQPFSQDYGLASQSTHVVCVNFIHEWRDLQFNVDFERQIFEKLSHDRFITLRSTFLHFVLMSGLGLEPCLYV